MDMGQESNNTKYTYSSSITPVKPINTFSSRWNNITKRVTTSNVAANIVVVGGGHAGVEAALIANHYNLNVLLVTMDPAALTQPIIRDTKLFERLLQAQHPDNRRFLHKLAETTGATVREFTWEQKNVY